MIPSVRDLRFRRHLLPPIVAGVSLRLFYVLFVVRGNVPPLSDAQTYYQLGRLLAEGKGYIQPFTYYFRNERVPTADFPPLYPIFLAVVGFVGIDSYLGQRVVGAILGGATIAVVAQLGAAIAGRTVGIAAAWFAALYPQLVLIDGSLMSEGPYVLIVASLLLSVVRARSAESERQRLRWWIGASVMVGLAVMTRSESLLFVPLLLIPATRIRGDRRAWARTAAVAGAGAILMTGAWTIRNAIVLHHFQPLTNNSGWTFAGANCDAVYSGTQIGGWRLDCIPQGLTGDETERSAQARALGLDYMRDHSGEIPAVLAARLGRTFGVWDVRTNLFIEHFEGRDYDWLWAAWCVWVLLAPLAIFGAVVQWRTERGLQPLLTPVLIVAIVTLLTYGNQRFRAAAEPSIVVFAAVATVRGVERAKLAWSRWPSEDVQPLPSDPVAR